MSEPGKRLDEKTIYRHSLLIYLLVSLVPLAAFEALFILTIRPMLLSGGGGSVIALSQGVLVVASFCSVLGFCLIFHRLRRWENAPDSPAQPFFFFRKVYVVASLVPLAALTAFVLAFILPVGVRRQNLVLTYSVLAVIALGFALSRLGFAKSRKGLTIAVETLQKSRENLDRLVKITAAISEVTHVDQVYEKIVESVGPLLNAGVVFLFTQTDKGMVFRAARGDVPYETLDSEARTVMEAIRDRAVADRQVVTFDASFIKSTHLQRTSGAVQGLAAPLLFGAAPCGVILALNKETSASGVFSPMDVDMLESFAVQSAISFKNAESREIQINYFTHTIELLVLCMEGNIVPRNHLRNVAQYSDMISRGFKLGDGDRRDIHFAALLHDIGMVKIPPGLHASPEHFRLHPVLGSEMVGRIILWKDLDPIIKYHHENFDGTGYPERLQDTEIPLTARILSIAESFDAMTNTNTYRSMLSVDAALAELRKGAGIRYDPKLVDVFEREVRKIDLE